MEFNQKRIAIVGLGLMGGSLAFALKDSWKKIKIFGVSRSDERIKRAVKKKMIDGGATSVKDLLERYDIDIVIVATPVSRIIPTIKDIEKYVNKKIVVTDVGSTKEKIVKFCEGKKLKKVIFVGSHPMAGSHDSGLTAARHELYNGTDCFVTKTARTSPKAFSCIRRLWQSIGVSVVQVKPDFHDRILATISHLPHMVVYALVDMAYGQRKNMLKFAGCGFNDTTRIAQSDAKMWVDIVLANKKNVLHDLCTYQKSLQKLISLIRQSDEGKIKHFLQVQANHRRGIVK